LSDATNAFVDTCLRVEEGQAVPRAIFKKPSFSCPLPPALAIGMVTAGTRGEKPPPFESTSDKTKPLSSTAA